MIGKLQSNKAKNTVKIIEKISNDLSDKIECFYHDIEKEPNEPVKFSVRGVPTVILFKDSNICTSICG